MRSLADRLEGCYSGAVYDVLRSRGVERCVLPSEIVPLEPGQRIAGPAFTVGGRRVVQGETHDTVLEWTRMLAAAPAGSVVVCQPNDLEVAHMGELSAETLAFRGVRGYVVDGGCRDTEYIIRSGFPIWCRYTTPRDIVGTWLCEELGNIVTIGDVSISANDYVLADRDGVVVIPNAIVEETIAETEKVLATENLVRRAILEGVDPTAAYLRHGKF